MGKNLLKTESGKKFIEEIKKPLEISDSWSFLKTGKVRVIIIYEDLSFNEFFKKLNEDYLITIKEKKYILIPESVIRGKYNTFVYYYNNPYPIRFTFTKTKLTSADMYNDETFQLLPEHLKMTLTDTYIDAKALHVAFSSNLINKMYALTKMSTMNWLIIIGAILIVVLVILQVTGTVDVMGALSGAGAKK